jgi:hypothetical protein
MFLGLLHPDQFVRGMDPNPDPDPQRHGSADPDPGPDSRQNVMDPQHCLKWSRLGFFRKHSVKRCNWPGGRSRGGGWRGLQLRLGRL